MGVCGGGHEARKTWSLPVVWLHAKLICTSVEDAKKLEDYEMMAACLPRVEAERAKRRKKTCVVC